MVIQTARAIASKEMLLSRIRRRREQRNVRFGTLLVAAKLVTHPGATLRANPGRHRPLSGE
jgi:hypothetical protein